MGADASFWLAIGLALPSFGVIAVAVLCHTALRRGTEFEGEIKAPSFSLRFHSRPPDEDPPEDDV
jgi:hypothetical protein